jgi:hypothetical protein
MKWPSPLCPFRVEAVREQPDGGPNFCRRSILKHSHECEVRVSDMTLLGRAAAAV